jgi:hypothetical protein
LPKTGYSAAREKRLTEGLAATKEPWFDSAIATVAESVALTPLRKLHAEGGDIGKIVEEVAHTDRSDLPGSELAINDQIPTSLPDEVDALVSGDHDASNQAAWLWGAALARICSDDNGSGMMLEAGWTLALSHDVSAEAFLVELSDAYNSHRKETLSAGICTIARNIKKHPEACVYRNERKRFLQALENWEKEANFAEVWESHQFEYFPFHCDSAGVLDVLRRTNPKEYLVLLDEIRLPPVTEDALRLIDISEDIEAILELLALTPPVTLSEADGEFKWNGNIGAAYLLETALDYAKRLTDVDPNFFEREVGEAAKREKEVAAVFTEVTSVLLDRQDGLFLAIHWMCHLLRSQRQRRHQGAGPVPEAIEALTTALKSTGVKLCNFSKIFPNLLSCEKLKLNLLQLEGIGDLDRYAKPSGIDLFWAALRVHTASDQITPPAADEAYFETFQSLLIRQDGGLCLTAPESHPESHLWLVALMYAMDENPFEKWLMTWKLLVEQRRLFRHRWSDDRTMWAEDPSFYLANVGLLLIDWLISPEIGKGKDAARAFGAVFDTVLDVAISPPGFKKDRWRYLLSSLFSRQPHIAQEEANGIVAGRQLARLGGDYELIVWCLANLLLNGADVRQVSSEFERQNGIALKGILEDFIFWESRESNRRPNLKLIEEAQGIISQIPAT